MMPSPSSRLVGLIRGFCVWGAAAFLAGCGEPIPPVDEAAGGGVKPLVTVAVASESFGDWTLPANQGRILETAAGEALLLDKAETSQEITHLIPALARGAGHVALRVMSDRNYRVGVQLGSTKLAPVDAGNTRREWRELMFALPAPLSFEEGEEVVLQFGPMKAPVLIEAIRFLP